MARRTAIDVDLSGKTAIVTGANSGIGKQIAENLAAMGATVVMACRSLERGNKALDEMAERVSSGRLVLMQLDQSNQRSIREFCEAFATDFESVDILVNNAGIYPKERTETDDGIELTWATNVMGYFLLTRGLHPQLEAAAPSRVIFIASGLAGGLEIDDLQWNRRRFGGVRAYKQSKQANRMLAWVFAERYASDRIAVHAVHPGGINTGISRHQTGVWGLLVRIAFATQKSVATGADTATWLAATDAGADTGGIYWYERTSSDCEFRDMDACRQLWDHCEQLVADS